MKLLRDADIDPAPLVGKRVAILGYGNQGRAQALNLHDSGIDVVVGLRPGSASRIEVESAGLGHGLDRDRRNLCRHCDDAGAGRNPCARFTAKSSRTCARALRWASATAYPCASAWSSRAQTSTSSCSHRRVRVLRSARSIEQGKGMIAVWAVAQDATGQAREIALAYGRAIGCGRAGLIASSFAEEAEADLFNEQAVVWGAVPELLIAGFETLVEGGVSPELAFLECVGELKLIAELIEARGIAGMREAISNTAELGALLGGRRIVDDRRPRRMAEVLEEVRAGRFAEELKQEEASGYARLETARADNRATLLEQTWRRLNGAEG